MPQLVDSRFPQPIQEIWATLYADVVWLHGRWKIYRQLFGTKKERVDLLNEAAGAVTWMLQNVLLHDVQLWLSKIGDPAGAGDKKNLTLRGLQYELREAGEADLVMSVEPHLVAFELAIENIRYRRNKWIAHNDLVTRLQAREVPFAGPSRDEIDNALTLLRAVMNHVQMKFTESETAYEHFVMNQDGEHLVTALAQGKRYRELVKEGVIALDDLRKRFPGGV